MTKNQKIKDKLEKIFTLYKTEYDIISDNNTISYALKINYPDTKILKAIGSVSALLICNIDTNTISIVCVDIYTLEDSNSLLSTLVAINNANTKISYGNIVLRERDNKIAYYYRIKLSNILKDLNEDIFNLIITSLLVAIITMFTEIQKVDEHEQ